MAPAASMGASTTEEKAMGWVCSRLPGLPLLSILDKSVLASSEKRSQTENTLGFLYLG